MTKKTKVEENFLSSGVFTFESYRCNCEAVMVSDNISEYPISAIKCAPDTNSRIRFAFGSKIGLVRVNSDGSIAEKNILGKLVSIRRDNLRAYVSFFSENGFLFPIDKPDIICLSDIQLLSDRLRATLELISTITDMSRTSYEKIIRMTFYLLFAPIISIETKDGKYRYRSDRHQYSIFLESRRDACRDDRLKDTFNNAEFSFSDCLGSFVLDADYVDSVLNGSPADDKYTNPLFQDVFTAYCSPREGTPKSMLYINDFVFHYLYEIGIIDFVDLEKVHYVNDEMRKENLTDKMKDAAVEVAKYIIKEEIESNLHRVRPTYNTTKLEPAWKIDSLLSALYFGLFYMRPSIEVYRRCANPKCNEFFLVPVSSRKKKYCCTDCMNRNMAARKRARDKIQATKDE